jgi:hypothetical protein
MNMRRAASVLFRFLERQLIARSRRWRASISYSQKLIRSSLTYDSGHIRTLQPVIGLAYAEVMIEPNPEARLPVIAEKGRLNCIALGGNHDERRFGQFSLRLDF